MRSGLGRHVGVAHRVEERRHPSGLAVPHLEHEPAARLQDSGRSARDGLRHVVADEREVRFVLAHVRHQRRKLVRLDVGRVGDDEVVGAAGESLPQVVLEQVDRQAGAQSVLAGERERVGGDVDRGHARARMLVCDREGDRAAARADVEHQRCFEPAQMEKRALDDDLRLGPRDQRAPVDGQRQPAEAPLAEDVRDRLAAGAARDELAVAVELAVVERPVEVRVELDALPAERVREQQLRVEPRRLGGLAEVLRRAPEDVSDRHASSARRRSSACSASVKSPSPPGSTFSRFTVTLTRWSVARLSG